MKINFNKEIWEGWTVQNFINDLDYIIKMIMNGQSRETKFQTKEELRKWLKNNQSGYKKEIPEVVQYFSELYKLK